MRIIIKDFIKIVSETLPTIEPVYEFGALQVPGQEGFADLRPFFPGKEYVGCDIREGPGVDHILDLHNIAISDKSVGTVLLMDTIEHVEFFRKAISEIYRILKPNGIIVISSVMLCPIHGYPYDYWRFTPQGFESLLKIFSSYYVNFVGEAEIPHTVIGVGFKGTISPNSLELFKENVGRWKEYWNKKQSRIEKFKKLIKHIVPGSILKFLASH